MKVITLGDLENIIDDDACIELTEVNSKDFPKFYVWKELKKRLKEERWNRKIHKITSYAGIYICLEQLLNEEEK